MKKIFILTCLLLSVSMAFAQTKKVAILEIVDREGKLNYSQELVLRSNLAKAVSKTKGYEAYDRSDLDAIMGEQQFQRTGMVSDSDIRKLGEMTGVSYILVSEGALMSDNKIFVSVKLLNIETAKVEITDNGIMGLSSEEMQQGCEALVRTLFGSSESVESGKEQSEQSADTDDTTNSNSTYSTSGYASAIKSSMSKKEYEYFLRTNCPRAYTQYKSGRSLVKGGWTTAVLGIALLTSGAAMTAISKTEDYDYDPDFHDTAYYLHAAGCGLLAVGATGIAVSVPILVAGYVKVNKADKIFDSKCAAYTTKTISFNLTAGQNGLGIAMVF